jgi:hypothetical protein
MRRTTPSSSESLSRTQWTFRSLNLAKVLSRAVWIGGGGRASKPVSVPETRYSRSDRLQSRRSGPKCPRMTGCERQRLRGVILATI